SGRGSGPTNRPGAPTDLRPGTTGRPKWCPATVASWPDPRKDRACVLSRWIAEEIALAELHAVVPQDVVGGGDVEVEVRPGEALQVLLAAEFRVLAAQLEDHFAPLGAVDLLRLQRLHEIEGLGDACFQLGEGLLVVLVLGHLDPGEARGGDFGGVA